MAMVETGYRYTELYWAGQDQNWEYAHYQLDKIKTAIENGIERRPKRAQSQGFMIFQSSCRSCHIAEKVPFIQSTIPERRLSPVKFTKE